MRLFIFTEEGLIPLGLSINPIDQLFFESMFSWETTPRFGAVLTTSRKKISSELLSENKELLRAEKCVTSESKLKQVAKLS